MDAETISAGGVETLPPISNDILRDRAACVQADMRTNGFDALFVYSNPTAYGTSTTTAGYCRYLTDLTARAPLALVLTADGEASFLRSSTYDVKGGYIGKEVNPLWIKDVRIVTNYGRVGREILLGRIGAHGRIGLVGRSEMPVRLFNELTDATSWDVADADVLLARRRMIKAPEEIARLRMAARLSDMMHEALVEAARRPGVQGWQLMVEMESAARRSGAEYAQVWLDTGRGKAFYLDDARVSVVEGDPILAGTHVVCDGYWGQSIRVGSKGSATEGLRRAFELVSHVQDSGISSLRPGALVRDAHRLMVETASRYFPGRADAMGKRTGHGLGLDYSEPYLTDYFPHADFGQPVRALHDGGTDLLVEPGMAFEIHPTINARELCATPVIVGDVVLVTDLGPEVLTQFPRDLFEV